MAFQLSFTNENDDTYAQSYWKVSSIENTNFDSKVCCVTFKGYKSKAARMNGKPPIGTKQYVFTGADFDTYVASTANNIRVLAYEAAKGTLDVVATPAVLDSDGNVTTPAVYKSFFDGAVDV